MSSKIQIKIIDYGMGNISSVYNAFKKVGSEIKVIKEPKEIKNTNLLILPGVGAFGPAVRNLRKLNFYNGIIDFVNTGKYLFGICLGFQLLFSNSQEDNFTSSGFGFIKGKVVKFKNKKIIIPHIGWNSVTIEKPNFLFNGINKQYFYFDHSYYPVPEEKNIFTGKTEYGEKFCSMAAKDNIIGTQFHPEKSQNSGLIMIKNMIEKVSE